jgi:hypothetical protein
MPLQDYNNRLTPTAQAFAATAVTTNSQPLPATGADVAAGEPLALVFTITAGLSAVAGTLQFQAVSATAADGTTGQVVLNQTAAITDTTLAVGDVIVVPIPAGLIPIVAATATHIAGKVTVAASGTATCLVDIQPLNAVRSVTYVAGQPSMAVFA